MDDLQIIHLYFERSESAIKETETKYGKLCFRIASNILRDVSDSEECVNDTWFSVWNTIPPTRPNNFSAFLCKITRNLALKRLDYNKAKKRTPEVLVSLDELEQVVPDNHLPSTLEAEELGRLISAFLRKEKAEARNVFLRRYWYFDTVSDIASRYSFSESKVKVLLHRTRSKLREYLNKEGITL